MAKQENILIAFLSLGAVGAIGYYYLHNASQDMDTMYAERLIPISLIIESRSTRMNREGTGTVGTRA
ncbi:MCP four helix bundle domain-containing protein [Sporomusa silvacetica]|uniref:MCP four helix bundle domain-containing protein n=1 Tax=Sporomusa silvacetica TaxID=55504 RepID=UPI00146A0722|nr:MCP four helix bundle domain-containing protein [Sporomusa silvacetica]